ncbi:type VI secretion system contractile sheath small subunit [Pseudomonas sp. 3A(2025)]
MAAKPESKQHYLGRNRPPRVQITYDVEIGNALENKELPLVVGILSDLSGDTLDGKLSLDKRGFVDIDRDSFNTVLEKIKPTLDFKVSDSDTGSIQLTFNRIEDFSPENIVGQVDDLKALFEKRRVLQDLLIKLDGNEALDNSLGLGLSSIEQIAQLQGDQQGELPAPPADVTDVTDDNTDTPAKQP